MNSTLRNRRHSSEIPLQNTCVTGGFWADRQRLSADVSMTFQWEQFEKTGRLDNFRKAAGMIAGSHQGFFYNDSDVHKWAEAGFTILAVAPNPQLENLLDQYVDMVLQAQEPDGYLFTYNQLNFPGQRWKNLQIEHELYTLGHLIEAGIAAYLYAGHKRFFAAALKSADLITESFFEAAPLQTPGHQEIEIALLRLSTVTENTRYREMAERFLERRGRTPLFGFHLLRQFVNQVSRSGQVAKIRENDGEKPGLGFDFSENLSGREPRFISLRSNLQFLSGKYHQQHLPIRKMTEPIGHSVRWAYLQTAAALLYRQTGDDSLLSALEESWNNMVRKKTYVTGGIGSLPVIEGFGRPFELDNEFAYAETCAAIACIFWNWQMTLATGKARYAELTEWQLYNAAAVGLARDGKAYLYRNPLLSAGGLTRKPWFETACCPGNIARLWAQVGKYAVSFDHKDLTIHQYIDCRIKAPVSGTSIELHMKSGLPWDGTVTITLSMRHPETFRINLRIPGWSGTPGITVDGTPVKTGHARKEPTSTAGGYSPFEGRYISLDRTWQDNTQITLQFAMETVLHLPHPRVTGNRGMIAVSRGPVLYCLEDIDNPSAGVPNAAINTRYPIEPEHGDDSPTGVVRLTARDIDGRPLILIPYYCWANREISKMQVWISKAS